MHTFKASDMATPCLKCETEKDHQIGVCLEAMNTRLMALLQETYFFGHKWDKDQPTYIYFRWIPYGDRDYQTVTGKLRSGTDSLEIDHINNNNNATTTTFALLTEWKDAADYLARKMKNMGE
jgi:hypothetical protein